MPISPKLEVLSSGDFEMIHQATIKLLEDTGIVFHHDEVLGLFKDNGAAVDGNLVRLPQKLVEDNIGLAPSQFRWQARNDDRSVIMGQGPVVQPAAGPVYVHDLDRERWRSTMSFCGSYSDWETDGARDIVQQASKTYKEILAAAPDSLVDRALEEELEAYIKSESG